jgi:hypothetical protein
MIDQVHHFDPAFYGLLVAKDANQTPCAILLWFHDIHGFHEQLFLPVF